MPERNIAREKVAGLFKEKRPDLALGIRLPEKFHEMDLIKLLAYVKKTFNVMKKEASTIKIDTPLKQHADGALQGILADRLSELMEDKHLYHLRKMNIEAILALKESRNPQIKFLEILNKAVLKKMEKKSRNVLREVLL